MEPNTGADKTDMLTRSQLAMFRFLSDQAGLTSDDQRRALGLALNAWREWNQFLSHGPRPADPPVTDMLLRLGETAFSVSLAIECQAMA
ncbi:MAG: hypothetical protein B7Z80_12420 [Rhodospirillales bacterium 20-64-7]|nr:MAG: hypothetical protein B7Z80_12420 [Rhodospirillales bacterium 20-64-7]